MLELDDESEIITKLFVIKEMILLATSWVGWTESLRGPGQQTVGSLLLGLY